MEAMTASVTASVAPTDFSPAAAPDSVSHAMSGDAGSMAREPVPAASKATEEPLLVFDLPHRTACVRRLREADNRALEWQGGADLRAFYEEQWQAHRAGDICVLVADFNGFPIGQAAIHWRGKPTHPHIPDLQSLRVFPAFQGMQVGSRLLEASEQMVAARGFAQVSLAVGIENPRARALYERLGYYAIGQPYDDEWHYTDARGQIQRVIEHVLDLVKQL